MLQAKINFLNYLHQLLIEDKNSNIHSCLSKIKNMNLPVYDEIKDLELKSTEELVAVILTHYIQLYLNNHDNDYKEVRNYLPPYFNHTTIKNIKLWILEPKNISKDTLLHLTEGYKYPEYNELFCNKGFVSKSKQQGKVLYIVTSDYGYHDPWEPTDETDLRLIGIFDSKDKIHKTLEAKKLYYGNVQVKKVCLNNIAFDEKAWKDYENGFVEEKDNNQFLPSLLYDFSYDDDMYDDPMDI